MIKIYLSDLNCYNNGILHGGYITLAVDENELNEGIEKILKQGQIICKDSLPHEEFRIDDYEWSDYTLFSISEYEDIHKLNETLQNIQDNVDPDDMKKIKFLLENFSFDCFHQVLENIENVVVHEDCSLEDVAQQYVEECYNLDELPSIISSNIDYSSIANDMQYDGNYFEIDSDIYEYIG